MKGVGKAILVGAITGAAGGFIGAAAGAGAGVLFQGASKGVQIAAQFGAAMVSVGGFDVVTQYVMDGFSFKNFSFANLGTTLVITALTFGLAHRVSSGVAPTVDAPDAPTTTTDAPDAPTTTTDAPDAPTTTTDAPDAPTTTTDAPDAPTTTTDTPEPTTTTDAPDSASTTMPTEEVVVPLKSDRNLSGGKRHGIKQQAGDAQVMATQKPHGVYRSKADIEFANAKAATLEPGGFRDFELPPTSTSEVFVPGGNSSTPQRATHVRVRNNGDGTAHTFPINSTAEPIYGDIAKFKK
jgi:hypothetical protein